MYLNDVYKNKIYKIKKINTIDTIKQRFYDFGVVEGVKIKLLYISPSKTIKAYKINNSIISIRDKYAKYIEVIDG